MLTFFFAFPSPGDAAAEDDSPGGSTTDRARVVSPRRHRAAGARGRVADVARASLGVVARASGARAGVDVGMFPSDGREVTSARARAQRALFASTGAISCIMVLFCLCIRVLVSVCSHVGFDQLRYFIAEYELCAHFKRTRLSSR